MAQESDAVLSDPSPVLEAPASEPVIDPIVETPMAAPEMVAEPIGESAPEEPTEKAAEPEAVAPAAETEKAEESASPADATITATGTSALPYTPDNDNKPDPLSGVKSQGFSVGEFTGAAIYDYPLALPPGRNGMTPALSLTYSSQLENRMDNQVGYHWELSSFFIQRLNKKGVDRLYAEPYFLAKTPAGEGELVPVTLSDGVHGLYQQKVESAFARYEFLTDGTWLVTDKQNVRYRFGVADEARQVDPTDASRVYKWALSEIRDPNDNFIRYVYSKRDNQLYPKQIFYTGHGMTDGIFEIRFLPFADPTAPNVYRTDKSFSYAPGFRTDNKYLVTGIEVYADGIRRHQYAFTHGTVDHIDSTGGRQPMLFNTITAIAETGYGVAGVATTLPPVTFDYSQSRVSFAERTHNLPEDFTIENCNSSQCSEGRNVIHWDMTGDGLPDFEYFHFVPGYSLNQPFRLANDGTGGFRETGSAQIMTWAENSSEFSIPNLRKKVTDFDGDARPDVITSFEVHHSGNDYNSSTIIPGRGGRETEAAIPLTMQLFRGDHTLDAGNVMGDLNGDGLPDMLQKSSYPSEDDAYERDRVCLNRGNNVCELTDLWKAPSGINVVYPESSEISVRALLLEDCNLDGLADINYRGRDVGGGGSAIWLNDGKGGWVTPTPGTPDPCSFSSYFESNIQRYADLNGDGLSDTVNAYATSGSTTDTRDIAIQLGGRFSDPFTRAFPVAMGRTGDSAYGNGVRLMDVNGDGLDDVLQAFREWNAALGRSVLKQHIWLNTGERPYFLKAIHTAAGATIGLSYKTSAEYRKTDGTPANPALPFIVTTVSQVTANDGLGNTTSVTYSYEDGHFYFQDGFNRSLAGFRVLTKADAFGSTKTYFHQSEFSVTDDSRGEYDDHFSKRGLPYRVETYDNAGVLLSVVINRWERSEPVAGRFFPKLVRTVLRSISPASGTVKTVAKTFEYDAFGNTTRALDYGEVTAVGDDGSFTDTGSDFVETRQQYATATSFPGALFDTELRNVSGVSLSHKRYNYDDLPLGQVSAGNVTREESWLDSPAGWVSFTRTYDARGLLLTETNARGYTTTFSYDAPHLYPNRVTNAKGHVSQATTDTATGAVLTATDPNGTRVVNRYDGLGRLSRTQKSDPANPASLVTVEEAIYSDTVMPRSVHRTSQAGSGIAVESYIYTDGLRRTIEAKTEASGGQWATTGTLFDARGRVAKTLQPYFSASSAFEAIDDTHLGESITYDALNRPLSATNPVGTTSTVYDGWRRTVTDADNKVKIYENDARGRLVSVTERNAGTDAVTRYAYDLPGRLTRITDSLGNTRDFTYDSFGRRLTQTAPQAAGATTLRWTYVYDANSNLTRRTDPKGQVTNFTYDELDRGLTEDFAGTTDTELTFVYDSGAYALGRLSEVTGAAYRHATVYDPWGRVLTDSKTIGSQVFSTGFAYDLAGAVTGVTYPDSTQAANTFDAAHQLSRVDFAGAVYADNFTYSPLGQITQLRLGGKVTVTDTYDANRLYRLTARMSSLNGSRLQDFSYTYDAVGNLTRLTDAGVGSVQSIGYTYDDLHRLLTADYATGADQAFTYDAIGNMLSQTGVGAYTYDRFYPHRLTGVPGKTFGYDANGNITARGVDVFSYDYRDRLTMEEGSVTLAYGEGYDRVSKTVSATGVTKYYPNRYYETEGATTVKYVFAGDRKIGMVETVTEADPPPAPPAVSDPVGPYNNPSYAFTGTKAAGTSLWMNGAEIVAVGSATSWSHTAPLTLGANSFEFYVKNSYALESARITKTISYSISTPVVSNIPTDPVHDPAFTFTGTKRANTSLWVNGSEVAPLGASASWNHAVTLIPGENTFTILSKDSAGQASTPVGVTVRYTPVPVAPTVDTISAPVITNPLRISGTKPVGAAVLSGSSILVPASAETRWSAEVTLNTGANSFSFHAQDADGYNSPATDLTINYTLAPPTVNPVTSPVHDPAYTFTGAKRANTSLWVNGVRRVSMDDRTTWSYAVTLAPGDNVFEFFVKDGAEKSSTKTASTVAYHPTPSVPVVTAPVGPFNNPSYAFTGTKAAATSVWMNGAEVVAAGSATSWNHTTPLVIGTNRFEFYAKNEYGLESARVTKTIDYSVPVPIISPVTSPVSSRTLTLTGTKRANTSVRVNGAEASGTFAGTAWNIRVTLTEGDNRFSAVAADAAGQGSGEAIITVRYVPPPPPFTADDFLPLLKDCPFSLSLFQKVYVKDGRLFYNGFEFDFKKLQGDLRRSPCGSSLGAVLSLRYFARAGAPFTGMSVAYSLRGATLTWQDTAAASYAIYRSKAPFSSKSFSDATVKLADVTADASGSQRYTDSAARGNKYIYRIVALGAEEKVVGIGTRMAP